MSVIVVGLNQRTVPLEVLERLAVSDAALPKVLQSLLDGGSLSEVVVLSTCARIEVYAVAERFHAGLADIRRTLADHGRSRPEDVSDHLYWYSDDTAVSHLFEVAAGLDSAVLGEGEILAQVRQAWARAGEERAAGPGLSALFRHALVTGKRARSETAIARGVTSLSQAAVALARHHLGGSLTGRGALVVGAGEMGTGMAAALASGGAEVAVANRTRARAEDLATRVGGRPLELADLGQALARVDVVLCSTRAPGTVVRAGDLAPVVSARAGRPLLVVDVAVPRNVDPAVAGLAGVTLLDLDDVSAFAEAGRAGRRTEVGRVRAIVADEVARYAEMRAARAAAPMIGALRDRAEVLRQGELARYRSRLSRLEPEDRDMVEALTRQLLGKLLHEPTLALKEAAGTPRAERLGEALRTLFGL